MYKDYNDYELLDIIKDSDEEATNIMYKKYEPLINATAQRMFPYCKNYGLEISDLVQEGMLGLTNAINTFEESKDTLFYTYAKTCIERKIISASLKAGRLKHKFLNDSISFDKEIDDTNMNLEYFLKDKKENPDELISSEERKQEIIKIAEDELTGLEQQVFELKINGFEYKEIALILDKDVKSIDNALQRIKLKLKKILENN